MSSDGDGYGYGDLYVHKERRMGALDEHLPSDQILQIIQIIQLIRSLSFARLFFQCMRFRDPIHG